MKKSQRGFSAVGWLIIMGIGGFAIMCLLTVFPPYIDNKYIIDALKSLRDNPDFKNMDKAEIKKQIDKYLTINSVRGEASQSFKIKQYGHRTIVNANYEVRENFMGNVDVVISFKNQLDSDNPDACCEYLVDKLDDK